MDMLLFFRTIGRTFCRSAVRNRAASLIAFLLIGWSSGAHAFWSLGLIPGVYIPQTYYKHGAVYTRAIVLSPAGNPYYVEYDSSGNEGREIAEKTGEYERAQIMAGAYYRSLLQRLADAKTRYPEHEEMTAAAYRGSTFKTAGGETIQKPSIAPNTLTVLVRAENNRYLKDGSDLLLLELPIKASVQPSASSASLLLSEAGDILHQTANTIAFRVGFFGKDGKVATNLRRDHDSEIYGKMPSVPVSLGGHIAGGFAITDADGKYRMNYFLPACPGFTFEYTTPVYLELYYSRFNPRGNSMMPYYLVRQDYDFCNGLGVYSMGAAMVIATMATPVKPKFDFPVDLMVVDGAAAFANVQLGDKTAYNPETSDYAKTVQDAYDFDGDEKPEIIVPGKKVKKTIDGQEREVFVETAVAEAELQGIYLSSRHSGKPASTEETAPDFTRLIDTTADFKDRGLLQSISKDDLRDTDIYVFRESTGQLVAERRGLHENELYKTFSGVDDKQGSFRFTIQLRGAVENTFALAGRNGEANFTKWQSAGGFTEEFQKRTANHLKSGEQVRIIAINRPTGYMGSARINLNASLNGNLIDLNQARIQLTPPNLKVWAERKNKIERGMTKGEEKKQLIGNEGAGLGSDISIAIYTDWRDQDGGPLPEALADYGYTGRLAKIVAANQLAPVGANNLSQFKIKPGQQVQVIQLPEKVLAKQHLYLQVAGQPENRNPDFATGNGEGILKYRPSKYVPVQVPLHDEQASEIARQAYRKADKEHPELNLKKPEPMYAWKYRPEMQFSLYELNVEQIRKTNAKDQVQDIFDDTRPVLASSDKLLEFYYDLLKSEFNELDAWSYQGQKELVLAVGEQEIKATLGADQSIRFDNYEHLGALDIDDFLTMRLYANNDVGNTLWQFAFMYLAIDLAEDTELIADEKVYVSADEPTLDLAAILYGYQNLKPADRFSEQVIWSVSGSGNPQPALTAIPETGVVKTKISLAPKVGNTVKVKATLLSDPGASAESFEIGVIPGKPANIALSRSGSAYVQKAGAVTITATITDRNGNRVSDGTAVTFKLKGSAFVENYQAATVNGVATASIKGGSVSGQSQLTVMAQGISKALSIDVNPLTVDIVGLPDDLEGGRRYDFTARLSGVPEGEKGNVFIDVGVDKGIVQRHLFKTNAQGEIPFTLHTPAKKSALRLVARADINKPTVRTLNVIGADRRVSTRHGFVVALPQGSTQSTFTGFDGAQRTVSYESQEEVILEGSPGQAWHLDFDDWHLINRKPVYFNRFYNLIDDEQSAFKASRTPQVARSDQSPHHGLYSAAFDGEQAVLSLPYESALAVAQPGYSFWLNADQPGEVLDVGGGALKLVLRSDNTLQASLRTENGEQTLDAGDALSAGWHQVAVGFNGSHFYLAVDEQVERLALDAQGVAYAQSGEERWLSLGGGFSGLVSGLRLYDWSQPELLSLSHSSGTYDAQGRATAMVQVAAEYTNNVLTGLVTVGLRSASGDSFPINVLPKGTFDQYARSLGGVMGLSSVSATDISEQLTMAEMFPSADQPLASLFAKFVDAEAGGPLQVVLSGFAWMQLRPEMQTLHPAIQTFQSYYKSHENEPVLDFAAQYLAEAINQANSGNNFILKTFTTGMVVWAELINSNPAAAGQVAAAIQNHADFWTWIRFMSLPGEGWAGSIIPIPRPDMTCDKVLPEVNAGTPYAYSTVPCRIRGALMAELVTEWMNDPALAADPSLLSDNLRVLIYGLRGADFELTRLLFKPLENPLITNQFSLIPQAHAAGPAVVGRLVIFALKAAVKAAATQGPVNLVNFLKNGTTSRFSPVELLASMAYLESRTKNSPFACADCKHLEPLVSENVQNNLIKWFTGLALANKGEIADEEITRRDCMLNNRAHGAAMEIVATAGYHALYEFGDKDEFQILQADPTGNAAPRVALMSKEADKAIHFGNSAHQRQPDLILAGKKAGERYWVELKSWRYKANYLTASNQVNKALFPLWDGKSSSTKLKYTQNAQRQHFLDYLASREALNDDFWKKESEIDQQVATLKPYKYQTWIQVWKSEERSFVPFKKKGDKTPAQRLTINTATPWIDTESIPVLNAQFRAVQDYLTSAPSAVSPQAYKHSVGHVLGQHKESYQNANVGNLAGTVAPFTLRYMLVKELGGSQAEADRVLRDLTEQLGGSDLAQYMGAGELSDEQKAALRKKVEEQVEKNLSVLKDIQDGLDKVTPDKVIEYEEKLQDYINGWVGDSAQELVSEVELPEWLFKDFCEPP